MCLRPPPARRNHGFTLIEMIVSIVLFGLIMAMVGPTVSRTFAIRQESAERLEMTVEARHALDVMTRELRQVRRQGAGYQFQQMNQTRTRFTRDDAAVVTVQSWIRLQGTVIQIRQLGAGGWRTLVDDVGALTFNYQTAALAPTTDPNSVRYVEIVLTLYDPSRPLPPGPQAIVHTERTRVALRDQGT